MEYTTIGVDVSKAHLDVFFLPTGEVATFANTPQGFRQLQRRLSTSPGARVFMESTSCYHLPLARFLAANGVAVFVVNPKHVRDFAKACGRLAKTDRLDAEIIARFGELMPQKNVVVSEEARENLKRLSCRRRQVVMLLSMEKNHLEKAEFCAEKEVLSSVRNNIRSLEKQVAKWDAKLLEIIAANAELSELYARMTAVQGIGQATAVALIADLPELGRIGKRQIAALAGLAPMNCDSGSLRGQRHIRGGRRSVRCALYMATISATRCNDVIRTYYKRLRTAGKPPKSALTACMRKLLLHLNSIAANL